MTEEKQQRTLYVFRCRWYRFYVWLVAFPLAALTVRYAFPPDAEWHTLLAALIGFLTAYSLVPPAIELLVKRGAGGAGRA